MVAGKSKPRAKVQHLPPPPPLSPSQFSHSATKVAVAQICRSAGFKACQPSALEALTKISTLYIESLARYAADSANVSGRTQSNLIDVVCGLEELASPIGFSGASRHGKCLLSSGVLKELRSFVGTTKELPYAKPMPVRPGDHVDLGVGYDRRRRPEIPSWLPKFPDVVDVNDDRGRSELYWEEKKVEEGVMMQESLKKEKKRAKVLPLRRDRVKFRVLGKKKGNIDRTDNGKICVFGETDV